MNSKKVDHAFLPSKLSANFCIQKSILATFKGDMQRYNHKIDVQYFLAAYCNSKPMTDDPSSLSKKLVRETRTKNSVRMSRILARVFSHARNLFRVGHVENRHNE